MELNSKLALKYIHTVASETLKVSETKHSGLIVFNSVLLLGIFINYDKQVIHFPQSILMLASLMLFLSFLSSFLSIFPITGKSFLKK